MLRNPNLHILKKRWDCKKKSVAVMGNNMVVPLKLSNGFLYYS